MREILFRGERVDNGKWAYGSLITDGEDVYVLPKENLLKGLDIGGWIDGVESYEFIPKTVGQYTGLKDKNGVKIFENDIVRYGKKNWVVNWNDETFRWEISLKDGCYQYPIYDGQGYPKYVDRITLGWVAAEFQLSGQLSVEVIGNKFDNPELIERDNNEKDWIF